MPNHGSQMDSQKPIHATIAMQPINTNDNVVPNKQCVFPLIFTKCLISIVSVLSEIGEQCLSLKVGYHRLTLPTSLLNSVGILISARLRAQASCCGYIFYFFGFKQARDGVHSWATSEPSMDLVPSRSWVNKGFKTNSRNNLWSLLKNIDDWTRKLATKIRRLWLVEKNSFINLYKVYKTWSWILGLTFYNCW